MITGRHEFDRRANDLVGLIYDASVEPAYWTEIQKEMCALSGSLGSHVLLFDRHRRPIETIIHSSLDERAAAAMEEDYIHWYHQFDDYRIEAAIKNGPSVVMTNDELTPADRKKNCPLYNEYFRYYDAEEQLIYGSPISNDLALAIVHARPREAGAHNEEQRRLFLYLANHIHRAMAHRQQLKLAASLQGSLVEVLLNNRLAAIAVDEHGRVIWRNEHAQHRLLESKILDYTHGQLTLNSKQQNAQLDKLIRQATLTSGQGFKHCGATKVGSDEEPILLTVYASSVEQSIFSERRSVAILLFSFPGSVQPPPIEVIQSFFGLTPSEARLVFSLAQGKKLDQCANDCSITISTARSYLKNINTKMNCNSQNQVVSKIMSLVV